MMAANYRHNGGGENRLGRHYSRFAGIWPTSFLADQSLTLRKSQNAGSNRPSRAKGQAGQFSYHVPFSNLVMGYSKKQKAAKDFLRWICSKEIYDQWFTSQQGFSV